MSPYLGRARHLCTAATAAAASAAIKPVTISQIKRKLSNEYDRDEFLKIYSSYTDANDPTTSADSVRYVRELTVRRLAKSHRFSDIKSFLESHKSLPQITSEYFLSSLIRCYGFAGMFEDAVNTYNDMTDLGTPRSTLSFNSLLSACIHSKVFDRVPTYFNEFPAKFGFAPDKFSYGILIKSYCEMGSVNIAMEKLNEIEGKGIEIDAVLLTTILHALYKNKKIEEAGRFFDEMVTRKGFKPDVGLYNVRLCHIPWGKPEAMKGLIEEMNNAELKPNIISYNYLITCYCLNGMMDEAKKVYSDLLKGKGIKPNSVTFRTLVFHLCKKGRFISGYKLFKKSVRVGKIPDFNTLKYLVEGLAKEGNVSEAKALVRTMNKKFSPELLKAWEKIAGDLGLTSAGNEEVGAGEAETEVDSLENEKVSS